MSKRAAAVQLTSDNYEEDEKDCDEVRQARHSVPLRLVGSI